MDFLNVQQLEGLRERALGIHFEGVVAATSVDVGAMQQFKATCDDQVIAGGRGRESEFNGAAVIDEGRQHDRDVARDGDAVGGVLVQVDPDRHAIGVKHWVAVLVFQDDLRPGLEFFLEEAGYQLE